MKAAVFRRLSWKACSINSTGRRRATMSAPVPASGSRSRAGSGCIRCPGDRRMNAPAIKVLVIDDEPPIRKLLRMGLSTQGYDILEAANAKASLELLGQKPDLVILDLGLPDMQGL